MLHTHINWPGRNWLAFLPLATWTGRLQDTALC